MPDTAPRSCPRLHASGGEVLYEGRAAGWFIGPQTERWDHVLIVRQASVQRFLAFASDPAAQTALGHRSAALEDSRLLPSFPVANGPLAPPQGHG